MKTVSFLSWLARIFKRGNVGVVHPHMKIRRAPLNTNEIRDRLVGLGWQVRELPIKKQNQIVNWRLIGFRGSKSFEVSGKTLDEAMNSLGVNLGVIART